MTPATPATAPAQPGSEGSGGGTVPTDTGPVVVLPGPEGPEDNSPITLDEPTQPAGSVAVATTTPDAPLVPIVTLLADELPQEEADPSSESAEADDEASTALAPGSAPPAVANVGGEDDREESTVAWEDSDVGPDVDDRLRQLDLSLNAEDTIPATTARWSSTAGGRCATASRFGTRTMSSWMASRSATLPTLA